MQSNISCYQAAHSSEDVTLKALVKLPLIDETVVKSSLLVPATTVVQKSNAIVRSGQLIVCLLSLNARLQGTKVVRHVIDDTPFIIFQH